MAKKIEALSIMWEMISKLTLGRRLCRYRSFARKLETPQEIGYKYAVELFVLRVVYE